MEKIFKYIEHRPLHIIMGLFLFHITIACLMSWIAYSPYLSSLHNGQGFWKFAIDSTLYHREALTLIDVLNEGKWKFWWLSYPTHMQVKWIALIYWVSGETAPILFEIVNSFVWVISVSLIYRAGYYLFNRNIKIACFSVLFLFFPSVVLSSTQLLREPFYILGLCFIVFGWVTISRKNSGWRGALSIITGFFFVVSTREYITPMMFSVFCVWTLVSIFYKNVDRAPALLMLVAIYLLSFGGNFSSLLSPFYMKGNGFVAQPLKKIVKKNAEQIVTDMNGKIIGETVGISSNGTIRVLIDHHVTTVFNIAKDKNTGEITGSIKDHDTNKITKIVLSKKNINGLGQRPRALVYLDTKVAERLSAMRHGFRNVNKNAGSGIDETVHYKKIEDVFGYLPRAVQIGFLSPFPDLWVSSGRQTGVVGRMMAGLETFVLYIIFIGFFWVLFKDIKIMQPLVPVLVFSGIVIVLLGFVVPNIGTIYRMRQGLLIPYFMLGVYGVSILGSQLKTRILKKHFL